SGAGHPAGRRRRARSRRPARTHRRDALRSATGWTAPRHSAIVRAASRDHNERRRKLRKFLKQFFTWWNSETLGLRFFTWRKGEFVGEDEFGNRYYRAPSAIPDSIPERRWVVYNGYAEGSTVPPGWHGWM